jgi:hypothetical protein
MSTFTYRSARSGSLVFGMGLVIGVETLVMHLWLRLHHPVLAWSLTAASVSALCWLAADYLALGRGAIRFEGDVLDLRVGQRVALRVPLTAVAAVKRPTWQELPAAGTPGSEDYRNLMKPSTPNVLVTLAEPMRVRLTGGIERSARRLGLRLDDPAGFIGAVESAREPSWPSVRSNPIP